MLVLILTFLLAVINIKDWSGVTILAVFFLLWSEFVFFDGFLMIEKLTPGASQIILRSGNGGVIVFYSLGTMALSLLFLFSFKQKVGLFFSIQAICIVAAIIFWMVFLKTARSVKEKDKTVFNASSQIASYEDRLNILSIQFSETDFAKILKNLAESLRFTDSSAIVPIDSEIGKTISELEIEFMKDRKEESKDKIDSLCITLNSLIAKRKIDVNATKRGGV